MKGRVREAIEKRVAADALERNAGHVTYERKSRARARRQILREIFMLPGIIAVLSGAGLVSALLGDDIWDAVSWLTLSVPLAVVAWCLWRRRR